MARTPLAVSLSIDDLSVRYDRNVCKFMYLHGSFAQACGNESFQLAVKH